MKKILSVVLAFAMILSSFAFTVSAEEGGGSILDSLGQSMDFTKAFDMPKYDDFNGVVYNYTNTGGDNVSGILADGGNIEEMIALMEENPTNPFNNAKLFKLSVDFLYNNKGALDWNSVPVVKDDGMGGYTLQNQKSDFSLMRSYFNKYLTEKFVARFGDVGSVELYTLDNFVTVTNFIGHIINPNYVDIKKNEVKCAYTSEKDFYTNVTELSGLRDLIAQAWCNDPNLQYPDLLKLLGFKFNDEEMLGESKIYDAGRVSRTLVRSVIATIIEKGPLNYILELIVKLDAGYAAKLGEPIKKFFVLYYNAGVVNDAAMTTIMGPLNIVVNGYNPYNTKKLQLFDLPFDRLTLCIVNNNVELTEAFYYLMLYTNLVGKWNERNLVTYTNTGSVVKRVEVNNKAVVENMIADADKDTAVILKALFCADFTDVPEFLNSQTQQHKEETTNPDNIWQKFIKLITSYFESLADIFKKMFESLRDFGNF